MLELEHLVRDLTSVEALLPSSLLPCWCWCHYVGRNCGDNRTARRMAADLQRKPDQWDAISLAAERRSRHSLIRRSRFFALSKFFA